MRSKLLSTRYLQPGETENEMYTRVDRAVMGYCTVCRRYMSDGIFLPNSPTLANAGTTTIGGLSACYVLPITDSLESIYQTLTDAAIVHKHFGGTGFNFSSLRPTGSPIKSTGGTACGPLKVIELFNQSAETVAQGGKREGANMGILNDDHPDIVKFIHYKRDKGRLRHFNLSVGITDESRSGFGELVSHVAEAAWECGCPGMVFLNRLERDNPTPHLGKIEATNPCGEQPLLPYESCNLGSINLSKFVSTDGLFDYEEFTRVIQTSVEFLDRVIDCNRYPTPKIAVATKATRKIGLGIMGWADALIKMDIQYTSNQAIGVINAIGEVFQKVAHETSVVRGEELGVYPDYEGGEERRNATVTTIAPTGTLSYLAGCSSGIEPVYEFKHVRTSEEGSQIINHPLYELAARRDMLDQVAHKIGWEWHLKHQEAWQRYIDNAVSKTINIPKTTTVDEVEKIYNAAFDYDIKGLTIYRDGSKGEQVLTGQVTQPVNDIVEVIANRKKLQSGCGEIRVDCAELISRPNIPYEVVILTSGGCRASNEFMGKVISKYIHDPRLIGDEETTIRRICKTAHKVECTTAMKNPRSMGKSCADVIAKRMEQVWSGKSKIPNDPKCPQCGSSITFQGGCGSGECGNCGWSGCS